MSESRDYSLPLGFSDIGQFLGHQRQADRLDLQFSLVLRQNGWNQVELFHLLSRRIDQDLLFTEERELVWPIINEVVLENLNFVLEALNMKISSEAKNGITKAMVTAVWMEISRRRPRYSGDRRGTRN